MSVNVVCFAVLSGRSISNMSDTLFDLPLLLPLIGVQQPSPAVTETAWKTLLSLLMCVEVRVEWTIPLWGIQGCMPHSGMVHSTLNTLLCFSHSHMCFQCILFYCLFLLSCVYVKFLSVKLKKCWTCLSWSVEIDYDWRNSFCFKVYFDYILARNVLFSWSSFGECVWSLVC